MIAGVACAIASFLSERITIAGAFCSGWNILTMTISKPYRVCACRKRCMRTRREGLGNVAARSPVFADACSALSHALCACVTAVLGEGVVVAH